MKKLFITIAFVAATMFAQAQLFVGGELGLGFGGTKVESTKINKAFDFKFAPTVGYMFNDNMGVGVDLLFNLDKDKTPKTEGMQTDDVNTVTTFGFAPYFRYVFAEIDNFKFYADAKINFEMGKAKNKYDGKVTDGVKTTDFGINIVPGVQYNFTDHISMVASLNVLKLGFNSTTTKTPKASVDPETQEIVVKEEKQTENYFGLGINEATPLTVGFVYTF